VLLGVGEDGHTASLFPGSELLDERTAIVRAVYATHLKSWRVTMTLPLLNNARDVLFLVTGKEKAPIVQRVLSAQRPVRGLPATMIRPLKGKLRWMLDINAAAALSIV
jgi:6-phosphogluconolactonase